MGCLPVLTFLTSKGGGPCIGRSEGRHHHWAGYKKNPTHSTPFNHTANSLLNPTTCSNIAPPYANHKHTPVASGPSMD